MNDQTLIPLQESAGFQLFAPASLPAGLTLDKPGSPMSLPGFTSVVLKYRDASGKDTLSITEASPYQDSAQTMPAAIWDNAVAIDLQSDGFGKVTAHLYQSTSDLQLWWEHGPTSIRLESGGAPGTTLWSKDQLMAVAISMVPVTQPATAISSSAPNGVVAMTRDEAVARARTVVSTLGGNTQTDASNVTLATLSDETALGMPRPTGIDASAPVWIVEFNDALSPLECPDAGVSVCSHGRLTVVLNALTGKIYGFHKDDGVWH